jgi:Flp pilus assembly protein TadB
VAQNVNHIREQRPAPKDDRSLGELFTELSRETTTLIRQEVDLAKTEMTQKASKAGKDVGFMAAGGLVAYAGFLAILAGIIIILHNVMPWWASALLVGIIVAAIGGFLIWQGMQDLKQGGMAPTQTIDTLQEDTQWAKEQMK